MDPVPADDASRSRVALVGIMGAGKTTVGRGLAAAMGCRFLDLDRWIEERAGLGVREIFAARGEAAFRDAESETLAAAAGIPGALVLATGGGVVLREANRAMLRLRFHVVWLRTPPAVAAGRVGSMEPRPLLEGASGPRAALERILVEREALYRDLAATVVENPGNDPGRAVEAVLEALGGPAA